MNKQILPLFLVAVIAVAAALGLLIDRDVEQTGKQALFEALKGQANSVTKIVLSNSQGGLLEAEQLQGSWQIKDPNYGYYPANQERLAQLLNALSDATLKEAKTAKAENYARLGLESIQTPDSQSTLVELFAGSQKWQVLIGNAASSGVGHYIRKPSESQSWLVDTAIVIDQEQADWLKQPVLDIQPEQIASLARSGNAQWRVVKDTADTEHFQLENKPEGQSIRYEGILDSAVESVVTVRFDELMAPDSDRWGSENLHSELLLETFDGVLINVKVATLNDEFFVMFSSLAETDKPYWHAAEYKISSFTASQLSKSVEDFLEAEAADPGPVPQSIDEGDAPKD